MPALLSHMRADFKIAMDTRSQEGFTLIELLIASAMSVIVVGAATTMLISVMHRGPAVSERADQVGNARNAIETMTSDFREGVKVAYASPSQITVDTTGCAQGGGECSVSYSCAGEPEATSFECVREQGGQSSTVVTGLASPDLFCYYPNDEPATASPEARECGQVLDPSDPDKELTYVGIKIQFPQENNASENSTIEGGVALHNAPSLLQGTEGTVPVG
jgi:prepilin-type N-terminal cleavage/methylation domain-containing protein